MKPIHLKRRRALFMFGIWFASLCALATLGLRFVPLPAGLMLPPQESLEFTDRNGVTLREVPTGEHFSRQVSIDEIPMNLICAILAAEDKRFLEHKGIDWLALARAAWTSAQHGRVVSGASTISQQLIKITQRRPRSMQTKLLEAVTALRLEQCWSKDEILAAYLNRLDFGNLNVGVAAAANYYFGKPLSDLSDAEAALLAGLAQNPRRLNPHRNLGAAKRRQETVLRRMRDNGWLLEPQFDRAIGERLSLRPPRRLFRAPHFIDLVLRDPAVKSEGPLRTTLDLNLHRAVEDFLRKQVASLRSQNVHNGAAVVIENRSGNVLALVGSENYYAPGTGQVNGAWAPRSAGSTFKPFTYLLALERGATAATVLADVPTEFASPTGAYRPENYSRQCSGPTRIRVALANSLNIPAVKLLDALGGPGVLQERLRAWGLTTLEQPPAKYGLGLTIGNAETRLLELANAYAALARLGEFKPYHLVETPLPTRKRGDQFVRSNPVHAWLIADILSDNAARSPAFGRQSALRFNFPVACKTGTSSDFRDNWALGYTPEFTVGVWVGNFEGSAMQNVSGVTGAGPVLHEIFEYLHQHFGTSWFVRPAEIVDCEIHPWTGHRLLVSRSDGVWEKFSGDQLPPVEMPEDYDATGRARLGSEYAAWSKTAAGVLSSQTVIDLSSADLRLLAPVPGATYVLDPDVPSSRQLRLRAIASSAVAWSSPSLRCEGVNLESFAWLTAGEHTLLVRDLATGRTAETWVRVKEM